MMRRRHFFRQCQLEEMNEFHEKGFLLLKDFLPRHQVLQANAAINRLLGPDESLLDRQDIAAHESVSRQVPFLTLYRVLEHENILAWCESYFSQQSGMTYKDYSLSVSAHKDYSLPVKYTRYPSVFPLPFKWMRAVGQSQFTGPHFDSYYVGYGSPSLLTFWVCLSDLPTLDHGVMAVVPGSHSCPEFEYLRSVYGRKLFDGPVGSTVDGWIPESELSRVKWDAVPMMMGDVIVLHIDVLHKTLPNTSGVTRYSCDSRFQPTHDVYPPWKRS